ncbi:MAG TPA: hypothetical protein VGR22_10380 [Thermomicrobiales bacterium]|nr:hypothetical protein [Thermomicrobiales bacterium]
MRRNQFAPLAALVLALALVLGAWTPGTAHAVLTAHLHEGTCADSGEQPVDLGELGLATSLLDSSQATPAGPYDLVGAGGAFPTVLGHASIDRSLDDLLASPHVIDIHVVNDEEGTDVILACGAVGGVLANGELVFGLQSLPSEGIDTTGIAWLQANDDGTTTVRLIVAQGLAPGRVGAASSTPAS